MGTQPRSRGLIPLTDEPNGATELVIGYWYGLLVI